MPPEQGNMPSPTQPEPAKPAPRLGSKIIWIVLAVVIVILIGGGAYFVLQQQSSSEITQDNLNSGQTLPTDNSQQQSNDPSSQTTTNSLQSSNSPNTTQPTTVVATGKFALIPAKRQPVAVNGNSMFDPEYGLNVSFPTGWNVTLDKTYTNTDTQTLYLQKGSVKLTIQPSVFWYASLAESYSYDKLYKNVDSVFKQKQLGDGTLLIVGTDNKDAYFGDIFWGYQYPDGTWQVVKNILEVTGMSQAYMEQLKQKEVPVEGYLTKDEAKTLADSVYSSVSIDPHKVRNLGRITELIHIAGALDLQDKYHGGISRTTTMPQTVAAATYPFPTHNYNGTTQGVAYGWVDNSQTGGYCIYTRLEQGSPAEYYMISNVKRSKDYYSMSRGSYVTIPPKNMKECNS